MPGALRNRPLSPPPHLLSRQQGIHQKLHKVNQEIKALKADRAGIFKQLHSVQHKLTAKAHAALEGQLKHIDTQLKKLHLEHQRLLQMQRL